MNQRKKNARRSCGRSFLYEGDGLEFLVQKVKILDDPGLEGSAHQQLDTQSSLHGGAEGGGEAELPLIWIFPFQKPVIMTGF